MQRLSIENRFNTAAGIACQSSAEQGRICLGIQCLREFELIAHSAVIKPLISRKNQKARLTLLRSMLCGECRAGL